VVLGDNIFYGHGFVRSLTPLHALRARPSSPISRDPERFGVVEFDAQGRPFHRRKTEAASVELGCHGLYFYDVKSLSSPRPPAVATGELEITI